MVSHQTSTERQDGNIVDVSEPDVVSVASPQRKISRAPNNFQSPLSSMETASSSVATSQPSPRPTRKISRAPNIMESPKASDLMLLREIESKKLNHLDEDVQDSLQNPNPGHIDQKKSKCKSSPHMERPEHSTSKESDLISDSPMEISPLDTNIAVSPSLFTGGTRGPAGTRELERLLRIAKRDNQELFTRNRELRSQVKSMNLNRELFAQSIRHDDGSENDIENRMDQEDLGKRRKYESVDAVTSNLKTPNDTRSEIVDQETLNDLQHAYDLSDANCVFLEKQNHILADELRKMEVLVDQYKNDTLDQREACECAQKESRDAGKKLAESERRTVHLKQEIEYLEHDLEYVKSILSELNQGGEEKLLKIATPQKIDGETALRQDFEVLLTEKNSLLLECENLRTKIKLLEAENRFALDEARLIHLQGVESGRSKGHLDIKDPGNLSPQPKFHEIETVDQLRERKISVVVEPRDSIKSEGLAKRFRKLEKEHLQLYYDYEQQLENGAKAGKKLSSLEVEIQVLQTTNKALEKQIMELEDRKDVEESSMLNKWENEKLTHVSEGSSSFSRDAKFLKKDDVISASGEFLTSNYGNKFIDNENVTLENLEVIQEDSLLMSSSTPTLSSSQDQDQSLVKEKIRPARSSRDETSNGFICHHQQQQPNSADLRRESIQAVATRKELELLRQKLDSLETENSILKIESMKQSKAHRGSVVSRKLSNTRSSSSQWNLVRNVISGGFKLGDTPHQHHIHTSTQTEEQIIGLNHKDESSTNSSPLQSNLNVGEFRLGETTKYQQSKVSSQSTQTMMIVQKNDPQRLSILCNDTKMTQSGGSVSSQVLTTNVSIQTENVITTSSQPSKTTINRRRRSNDSPLLDNNGELVQFTVEDLIHENKELQSQIRSCQKKSTELEMENQQLEEINLKVSVFF